MTAYSINICFKEMKKKNSLGAHLNAMCCERSWLHFKISLHFLFINDKLLHQWTQ